MDKDQVTTILGGIIAIAESARIFLADADLSNPATYVGLTGAVAMAAFGWFTNKK